MKWAIGRSLCDVPGCGSGGLMASSEFSSERGGGDYDERSRE